MESGQHDGPETADHARERLAQRAAAARQATAERGAAARDAAAQRTAAARVAARERGASARDTAIERGREGRERVAQGAVAAREKSRELRRAAAKLDVRWARWAPARAAREAILTGFFGPMLDWYTRRRTVNVEAFDGLVPPVLLVANHSSHMDTPVIMRALPREWRQRTAVGAAADYFYGNRVLAGAVSLIFNTVPIDRGGGGLDGGAAEHLHRLLRQRWNLLLYPEGSRSRDGEVQRLRSGAAVLAAQHGLAIVPIYVEGTHETMPPGRGWPRRHLFQHRHPISVSFGDPVLPEPGEHRRDVTNRLQRFFDEHCGDGDGAAASPAAPATAAV